MKKILTVVLLGALFMASCMSKGDQSFNDEANPGSGLSRVAETLGITEEELIGALGNPAQGPPNFEESAEILGITAEELEEAMKLAVDVNSVEVDPYVEEINGVEFTLIYQVYDWTDLADDVIYERQNPVPFTSSDGETHYYEAVWVSSGNLNWYQAAYLAQQAGGYLACPTSKKENDFVFSLVSEKKFFWAFPADGTHNGISIGPFLGGYQPDGSEEPLGGWSWLSGEAWSYANWAVNLDDGYYDLDPRPNDQPNDSGGDQAVMGYGEMNLPVPTWGDYFEAVGTYGLKKSPGQSYGFIIEYEELPN